MRLRTLAIVAVIVSGTSALLCVPPIMQPSRPNRNLEARYAVRTITFAVNAYFTDYNKWPGSDEAGPSKKDRYWGDTASEPLVPNNDLFFALRSISKGNLNTNFKANPRRVVFFELRHASLIEGRPIGGFFDRRPDGTAPPAEQEGCLYDPWGHQYAIIVDSNEDGRLDLTGIYSDFTGENAPRKKVGVISLGKDGQLGINGERVYRKGKEVCDDVISWD